jgi:UDP-N-acetylglucosamine:LPS N-acetylglucosamine transferase
VGRATPTAGRATPTAGRATPTAGRATPTVGRATPTAGRATPTAGRATIAEDGVARPFQGRERGAESPALQTTADVAQGFSPAEATYPIDILVTMGGSDPAGMTAFALDALNLLPRPLAVQVVVGPAFSRASSLAEIVAHSKHAVRVSQGLDAVAPLMRASRLAVASFGVTAYELAACGVPAVHLCLTADHARSSSAFEQAQIAERLSVFSHIRPQQVAEAVGGLLGDASRRTEMAARARALIDGRGAQRVAALVVSGLS